MSLGQRSLFLSVVIPTHDRRDMVVRTVETLFGQDYPKDRMEVIVILDGCSDDTELGLQALDPTCQFRYVKLPKSGPSVARNKGIEVAVGDVVIFLDDDMECAQDFLSAHASMHSKHDNLAVQGYLPISPRIKRDLHVLAACRWWERKFERLAQPGRKIGSQDLSTGNLSVRRDHLLAVGGFDEEFTGYGNEDYELGLRLANHGLEFRFCREALAWHHYDTPVSKSIQRARQEAQADVIYGRKHPHLKISFRFFSFSQDSTFENRISRTLAFRLPHLGDRLAVALLGLMEKCEHLGLRGTWSRINWTLRRYYYWRGIKDSLGSFAALKEYLGDDWIENPAEKRSKVLTIDLRKGIKSIDGLEGYGGAYILLKDGPRPLTWIELEIDEGWISADDLKHAIEQQAGRRVPRNSRETVGVADTALPSRILNASRTKRLSEASRRSKWKATTRSADCQ